MEAGGRDRAWMGLLGGRPSCSRTAVGRGDPNLGWLPGSVRSEVANMVKRHLGSRQLGQTRAAQPVGRCLL